MRRLEGREPKGPFEYFDKGSMATISRFSAVASVGKAQFSGFFAWILWLAVHLVYIIGFKHRITTLLHWVVTFIGRGRSERVVTEQQVFARQAIADLGSEFSPELPRLAKDRPQRDARTRAPERTPADRTRPRDRLTRGRIARQVPAPPVRSGDSARGGRRTRLCSWMDPVEDAGSARAAAPPRVRSILQRH